MKFRRSAEFLRCFLRAVFGVLIEPVISEFVLFGLFFYQAEHRTIWKGFNLGIKAGEKLIRD
jgi:hypothetical protein